MVNKLALPLVALAFVPVGCGTPTAPSLKQIAPAQLPPGYVLQDAAKYGISIGIPPGWKVASGQVQDIKDTLAGMGTDTGAGSDPTAQTGNSQLDQMMKAQVEEDKKKEAEALAELEARGIIIHVMNVSTRGVLYETPTHFSVQISPNVSSTLEGAAQAVLEHVPGEEKPVAVTVPAGPAMLIRADKKMRDGGDVNTSKYVLQDGKTTIVVSFVTEADPTVIRTIEKPVMDTLRVVPGKAVPPPPSSGQS